MILYNVTLNVSPAVHDDWLSWMQKVHIPAVMATGFFLKFKICRLLRSAEEGVTYSVQYFCESTKRLHQYQVQHAPKLQKDHMDRYGEKVVAFRSLLEVLEEGV